MRGSRGRKADLDPAAVPTAVGTPIPNAVPTTAIHTAVPTGKSETWASYFYQVGLLALSYLIGLRVPMLHIQRARSPYLQSCTTYSSHVYSRNTYASLPSSTSTAYSVSSASAVVRSPVQRSSTAQSTIESFAESSPSTERCWAVTEMDNRNSEKSSPGTDYLSSSIQDEYNRASVPFWERYECICIWSDRGERRLRYRCAGSVRQCKYKKLGG